MTVWQEYETDFVLAQKQEKPGMRPFKVKNIKVLCGSSTMKESGFLVVAFVPRAELQWGCV